MFFLHQFYHIIANKDTRVGDTDRDASARSLTEPYSAAVGPAGCRRKDFAERIKLTTLSAGCTLTRLCTRIRFFHIQL